MEEIKLTKHAKERWAERFNNLSIEYEYSKSKKPKKRDMAGLRAQCPNHVSIMKRKDIYGLSYRISPGGVVFVCSTDGLIITVFPEQCNGIKKHQGTRRTYRRGICIKSRNFKHNW